MTTKYPDPHNIITIVGCGPGSADYLTEAARQAIQDADLLVGSPRLLALHGQIGQEAIVVGADIAGTLEKIAEQRHRRALVVLVSGDPGLCSLARPVLQRFGRMACRVIPGISSVQVAFARVGLDWREAWIIDAHHALPDVDPSVLSGRDRIAVLAGHRKALAWVVQTGEILGDAYNIIVCEDLTMESERIRTFAPGAPINGPIATRTIVLFIRKELLL